jgi:hypothetical protein
VGEKRFDNISDLVHDGLISFYIEKHASNYIAMMSEENNYAESPYVASRIALLASRQQTGGQETASSSAASTAPSIHSSFQKSTAFNQPSQQLMQQQQQQQHIVQQISDQHTIQLDKDNRHFSDSVTANSSMVRLLQNQHQHTPQQQHQHLQQHTPGSALSAAAALAKSNAIFDRFDIINSEKQHRFKSQNFKGELKFLFLNHIFSTFMRLLKFYLLYLILGICF